MKNEKIKIYEPTIAPKLRKQRIEAGFTQQQVSDLTQIPQSILTRFETGSRIPSCEQLAILADFYCVSVDWLLGTKGGK